MFIAGGGGQIDQALFTSLCRIRVNKSGLRNLYALFNIYMYLDINYKEQEIQLSERF